MRRSRTLFGLVGAIALFFGLAQPASAVVTITANPPSVDFGAVRLGSNPDYHAVTLTNDGDEPVTIGSISNSGGNRGDFAGITGIDPDTQERDADDDCLTGPDGFTERVLAPGESCIVIVFANPTGLGVRSTTMVVKSSVGTALESVPLRVTGTTGVYAAGAFGEVQAFGDAVDYGDASGIDLNAPIVDAHQVPGGEGYWLLGLDGGVFTYPSDGSGDARFLGSTGGMELNAPVIAMAPKSPDGYYLAALDGGIFAYGVDAPFLGSMGGTPLNDPVVAMAVDPVENGYWLVASDGGVFTFGNSEFSGSMVGKYLAGPIVGMASTPSGNGYWLVGEDGGVFAFGDAPFAGSMVGKYLAGPVVDIAATPTGNGYWLLGLDGGIFAFGDAPYYGNVTEWGLATGITGTAPPVDKNAFEGGFYESTPRG